MIKMAIRTRCLWQSSLSASIDFSAPPRQHSCVTQHSFLICAEVTRPCCRLPDQPINVTVDSSSLALIHSLTKYLNSLAPGWDLGQGYTVRWPPCVSVQTTSPSPDSTSYLSVFQTNYTMGCASLSLKETLVICQRAFPIDLHL